MKRSIPFLVVAVLFGVLGIYSLLADNTDNQDQVNLEFEEWFEAPTQPKHHPNDPGSRRPQLREAQNLPLPQPNPTVTEKHKRKYQIQIFCYRPQGTPTVQNDLLFEDPSSTPPAAEFFGEESQAPVWLYCDELEMKTTSNGYNLKIAGPFIFQSPGLSIRGMGLSVQDSEMSFTNGKVTSGGFTLDVEKCKLPFRIKSLQIDSTPSKPKAPPATITTF